VTEPIPITEATAPLGPPKPPLARYALVVAVLAFAAVVLWLNYREPDIYLYALDGPPSEPLHESPPGWFPAVDELTECRIVCRVDDHDGWYRLFWAGTDTSWFDDASYFGAALVNPSARTWEARWTFKGKHQGRPFAVAYALHEGSPKEGSATIDGLDVPVGAHWFTRRYPGGPRTFSWQLAR
jgi:hypothetical protein